MEKTNKEINPCTWHIRYNGNTPYFEIKVHKTFFDAFQSDHKLDLIASFQKNRSLKLIIRFKSFRSNFHFYTEISSSDKEDGDIKKFLSIFSQLKKIQVTFYTSFSQKKVHHWLTVSPSVRESCNLYLGHLSTFQPNDGLEETFQDLPMGFLVPYATSSYFLLLCKTDDFLFEKLKWSSYRDIKFQVFSTVESITLSLSFRRITLSSLTLKREDICQEILEDFHWLLKHQKIYFIITSSSMKGNLYLQFSKELEKETIKQIQSFFHLFSFQ